MIDKKVYRTDYESKFTSFFNELSPDNEAESAGVNAEVNKYTLINSLRDNADKKDGRDKLWEGF